MRIEILSRKLIKPSIPTPTCLKNYKISFTDELSPTMNVPLILYYPAPTKNGTTSRCLPCPADYKNLLFILEKSLEHSLTIFYPFAGRYLKNLGAVDCSDHGVEYVLAKAANVRLLEILGGDQGVIKSEVFNNFLSCEPGAADEISDPLLSIQMTMFDCGGLAMGFGFSHRVSDMAAFSVFIDTWAASSTKNIQGDNIDLEMAIAPIFNSAIFFPPRGLPRLDLRLPRTRTGLENDAKKFLFNKKVISALRAKAGLVEAVKQHPDHNPASKVELVIALLYKALVGVSRAKNDGLSKASILVVPVNLRDKVVPRLPKQSFGNFWGLATTKLNAGEGDNIEFKSFFDMIRKSLRETIRDCKKVLSHGEEGYSVVINPFLQSNEAIASADVNHYLITSLCKFSFYEADFGWGKPIWASTANLSIQNLVMLMDDKDGDGVEAWVNLDEKDMLAFRQDPDIIACSCNSMIVSSL